MYEGDDKRKYTKVTRRKRALKRKIREYVNSFTVHGLTRIVSGNIYEKIIWSTIVLTAMVIAVYITRGFVIKYLSHEIYIDLHSVTKEKAFHPSVTFCLGAFMTMYKQFYCGYPMFMQPDQSIPCLNETRKSHLPFKRRSDALWSNGIFHVIRCSANTECGNQAHFMPSENTKGACITWNWNKTLYEVYSKATIEFQIEKDVFQIFNQQMTVHVIIHEHEIKGQFLNPQINIIPNQTYHLHIRKSVTKRLPSPFPSNCTNNKPNNAFPGKYTRRTCVILDFDIATYKRCGDIRDFSIRYIPSDIKRKYKQHRNISDTNHCFIEKNIEDATPNCPMPCSESNYDMNSFVLPYIGTQRSSAATYSLQIGYQKLDSYDVVEERELYSWDKLASEFGGLLGLVIGASMLSVVEIMVYLFLCFVKNCV